MTTSGTQRGTLKTHGDRGHSAHFYAKPPFGGNADPYVVERPLWGEKPAV